MGHRARLQAAGLLAVLGVAAPVAAVAMSAGGGDEQDRGSSPISEARPPTPPPPVDRRAGPPAYLAVYRDAGLLLLDAQGRVARVLGTRLAVDGVCPGGRHLAGSDEWSGRLAVRRLGGRHVWRRRVPARSHATGAVCLDARGRRVALVQETLSGSRKTLLLVSRPGARRALRFRGEAVRMDAERLYIADGRGVRVHVTQTGRLVGRVPLPFHAHAVSPSPGGQFLALSTMDERDPAVDRDRQFVVDTASGARIELAIAEVETPIGWLDDERLVVHAEGRLHVVGPHGEELARVEGFRPRDGLVVGGRVVATDGRALLAVEPGAGPILRIGSVPRGTTLVAALV